MRNRRVENLLMETMLSTHSMVALDQVVLVRFGKKLDFTIRHQKSFSIESGWIHAAEIVIMGIRAEQGCRCDSEWFS